MSSRPDFTGRTLRFFVGACSGALLAFWLGLASETVDRHFGAVVLLTSLLCGGLAQIPAALAYDWLERSAPYVLGGVAIAGLLVVVTRSIDLKQERARCLECCNRAGFPAMIYAREHRWGALYCTCSDRSNPDSPRSDEDVCLNAGRGRSNGWPSPSP